MRTIGIAAHSYEGGTLSFLTACREGAEQLGPHMHPTVVVSAIPMGLSLEAWEANDFATVGQHLGDGVRQVADAGADFYLCPDNTAHIVLEQIATDLPIPGLHIADVVAAEISRHGWKRVGLLGTKWTMTGPVYERALDGLGAERLIPEENTRARLNAAIFDELCQGVFRDETIAMFQKAIEDLQADGAECVILGCTEIPLIITAENSALPVLDSTRLQARYAVREAIKDLPSPQHRAGWLSV